jgi:UDP-2,4-diacetamido-2,4,6-trideoxy-beta-L-altropyranose hydrolase
MPSKTLIIRADASPEIGVGHVMRCAALAQAWRSAGGTAIFALATGAAELEGRIRSWQSHLVRIHVDPGSKEDAEQTNKLCQSQTAEWLCLDGYRFSVDYRARLKSSGARLLLIDDHGDCPPYLCDMVLNANPQASDAMYLPRGTQTQLLLGPRYALLRQEFLKLHRESVDVPYIARRILVTLGGADPHNVTLKVMQALHHLTEPRLEITTVVGAVNPHLEPIQTASAALPHVARVLSNVENMPELISQSDLAITAGGGTCYELAFLRVPMFLITTAKNQEQTVGAFSQANAAIAGGWFHSLTQSSLVAALQSLIGDHNLRKNMIGNASQMVDGRGAERVVEVMRKTERNRG